MENELGSGVQEHFTFFSDILILFVLLYLLPSRNNVFLCSANTGGWLYFNLDILQMCKHTVH